MKIKLILKASHKIKDLKIKSLREQLYKEKKKNKFENTVKCAMMN